MKIMKSRMAAVAVGAAVLVTLGGVGGAVAGALVTSADIADGTIQRVDLKGGAVTSGKIKDGTIQAKDIASGVIPAPSSGGTVQYGDTVSLLAIPGTTDTVNVGSLTCPAGTYLQSTTGFVGATNLATVTNATAGSVVVQSWKGTSTALNVTFSGTGNNTAILDALGRTVGWKLGDVSPSSANTSTWNVVAHIACA